MNKTDTIPGLAESGPYTLEDVDLIERHRGKPYARLRETVTALDAEKADAARLRATGKALRPLIDYAPLIDYDAADEAFAAFDAALDATDSAEWLAQHDAEVRAPLRAQVETLTQQLAAATRAELQAMGAHCDNDALRAQVDSLTKQRDAARAAAARLREELEEAVDAMEKNVAYPHAVGPAYVKGAAERARAALGATDSADWLAKHDEEVRADMEKAIEAQAESVRMYAAKVASLEAQLAAATTTTTTDAALAATDSGAWLQQRIDAETAPLRARIAELEAKS